MRIIIALVLVLFSSSCMHMKKKIKIKTSNPTTEYIPPYEAFGNEPFWNCRFQNDSLKYSAIDKATIVEKVDSIEVYSEDSLLVNSKNISFYLKKSKCSDGMSDNIHEYSSRVIVHGNILNGCGRIR